MFCKTFCSSFFYEIEEWLILGFLSSSNCWGEKKCIPLLDEEQTLSPSWAPTWEDTANGGIQTSVNNKDPWSGISIFSSPNGAQCDSAESSSPVESWLLHPTQSDLRTLYSNVCALVAPGLSIRNAPSNFSVLQTSVPLNHVHPIGLFE